MSFVAIAVEAHYQARPGRVDNDTNPSKFRWDFERVDHAHDKPETPFEVSSAIVFNAAWAVNEKAEVHSCFASCKNNERTQVN